MTTVEEEVEPAKSLCTPYTPTAFEIAEHRIDHTPPRPDWCAGCAEAWGMEAPHSRVENESIRALVISCDYLFQTSRGVFTRKEWQPQAGETHLKVLVIYNSKSKVLWTRGAADMCVCG